MHPKCLQRLFSDEERTMKHLSQPFDLQPRQSWGEARKPPPMTRPSCCFCFPPYLTCQDRAEVQNNEAQLSDAVLRMTSYLTCAQERALAGAHALKIQQRCPFPKRVGRGVGGFHSLNTSASQAGGDILPAKSNQRHVSVVAQRESEVSAGRTWSSSCKYQTGRGRQNIQNGVLSWPDTMTQIWPHHVTPTFTERKYSNTFTLFLMPNRWRNRWYLFLTNMNLFVIARGRNSHWIFI